MRWRRCLRPLRQMRLQMPTPDRARLARLKRVERLREMERVAALQEAAQRHDAHVRLETLARRSRSLIPEMPSGSRSAAELAAQSGFAAQVLALVRQTDTERDAAGKTSHEAIGRLAQAGHRRDAVRDRARTASGELARKLNSQDQTAAAMTARPGPKRGLRR